MTRVDLTLDELEGRIAPSGFGLPDIDDPGNEVADRGEQKSAGGGGSDCDDGLDFGSCDNDSRCRR
jgi:hypothetical protein